MDLLSSLHGLWAIEEHAGQRIAALLHGLDARAIADLQKDVQSDTKPYDVSGGVAILGLNGPITKEQSFFSFLFGGSSSAQFASQVRQAASDPQVKSILLSIDSPGGQVAGIEDAADAVIAAKSSKPVYAHVTDGCCSAAYWIASQTSGIYANKTAPVGSIGVYSKLYDLSGLYDKEGVKVHLFKSGEHKGAGTPGLPLTEAQASEFQRGVDATATVFKKAVQTGRKMKASDVDAIADGRVWMGADAVKKGLIDGLASHDVVLSALQAAKPGRKSISIAADSGMEGNDMDVLDKIRTLLGMDHTTDDATLATEAPAPDATAVVDTHQAALAAKDVELEQLRADAAQARAAADAAMQRAQEASDNAPHLAAIQGFVASGKLTPGDIDGALKLRKADATAFDALMAGRKESALTPGVVPVKAEDVAQKLADGGDDAITAAVTAKVRQYAGKDK